MTGAVRTFIVRALARFARPAFAAANEEAGSVEAANDGVLCAEFAVVQPDGLFVPYGEYPNEVMGADGRMMQGVQVVDREAGVAMANEMSSFMGRVRSAFLGRPIFVGHPYHPDRSQRASYPDKRSRGWIKSIEVQDDGIKLVTAYNELGGGEVNDAQFGFHSPEWRLVPVPGRRNAFRPVMLRSTGLTNFPNIPVPPIVAANEGEPGAVSLDLNKIVAALKEAGLVKEGDDEAAIIAAIGSIARELQWARDAKQREAREIEILRAKVPCDASNEKAHEELVLNAVGYYEVTLALAADLKGQLDAANEAVRAERTARAELALEPFIKAGKVTGAKRDESLALLVDAANEAAFEAALQGFSKAAAGPLQTAAPELFNGVEGKTKVILASNEQSARSRERSELVHACLAEITRGRAAKPGDQEAAWNVATRRRPELFGS